MARIIIAVVYIAAILVIGILAGRNVKTSEEFATANRGIPFWTNVFSMSSAWIGAGSTLGCASMCYAYGVSGFYLAIGVGIGAMLSSLLFARKIRDENVSTIPELIRNIWATSAPMRSHCSASSRCSLWWHRRSVHWVRS